MNASSETKPKPVSGVKPKDPPPPKPVPPQPRVIKEDRGKPERKLIEKHPRN